MELHLAPELQSKIDQLIAESGITLEQLVEDALAGYFPELSDSREMLDSRYDDLKGGRVVPVPGDEVFARLHEKSRARRSMPRS